MDIASPQSSKVQGVCKLCGETAELRKSHILPEFLYAPLYDPAHNSFHVLTGEENDRDYQMRKGAWERLLCRTCEEKFSRTESYAANVLTRSKLGVEQIGSRTFRVSGIDYKLFKLFLLSLLWRASVSSHKLFRNVELGPHEDRLRDLLIRERPGTPTEYPCLIFALQYQGKAVRDLIDQPDRVRLFGEVAYRFIFGSFCWVFLVTKDAKMVPAEAVLSLDGSIAIMQSDLSEFRHLQAFSKARLRQGRS
jgi:hypothetical protein